MVNSIKTPVKMLVVKELEPDGVIVSRSQAKRLLAGLDQFKTVVLDFADVETIGQGFADQVFRVFTNQAPGTRLVPINTNESVSGMIKRAIFG